MSYSKGFSQILIIFGILAIGLVAGGFYLLNSKQQKAEPVQEVKEFSQPNPSPLSSPSPIAADAAKLVYQKDSEELKLYKSKFGFEFKYPSNWRLEEVENYSEKHLQYLFLLPPEGNFPQPEPFIAVSLFDEVFIPKEAVDNTQLEVKPNYQKLMREGEFVKPFQLGGIAGYQFQSFGGIPFDTYGFALPYKQKTLYLNVTNSSRFHKNEIDLKPTFGKILDSLNLN